MSDTYSLGRDRFLSLASDFPLIAPLNTASGLRSFPFASREGKPNLYFGTGLATTKAVTTGLPFDFLGMLVGAEFCRRYLGIHKIIHEISDTHATENNCASLETIHELAQEQKKLVQVMARNLGIEETYECLLASEYQKDSTYVDIHKETTALAPDQGHYFRYQWAGMAYLAAHKGVKLKVGWLADDSDTLKGFDERTFDRGYDQLRLAPLSYAYLKCGRNFASGRGRVSPYTSVEGEERIMLKPDEDAHEAFDKWVLGRKITKDVRQTVLHLANVITGFEALFGKIDCAGDIWSASPERLERRIMHVPASSEPVSINLTNLADKINAVLGDVFELRLKRNVISLQNSSANGYVIA